MSKGIGYTCKFHNCAVPHESYCKHCMERWNNLPAVESLTPLERAQEFEYWCEHTQVTVPFERIVKRLSELLGRVPFMHELASPNLSNLIAEAYGDKRPPQTLDDIVAIFPDHLKVIPLNMNTLEFSVIEPEQRNTPLDTPDEPLNPTAN